MTGKTIAASSLPIIEISTLHLQSVFPVGAESNSGHSTFVDPVI